MEVLYPRCAGLDVHKDTVVAAVRLVEGDGTVRREVATFATTTPGLCRTGWSFTTVRPSPWRRPASTGVRSGRCWRVRSAR